MEAAVVVTGNWLPEPCPLPILSDKTKEVLTRGIKGNNKFFLLREAVTFYEGLCPKPTNEEYVAMAKALCYKYPELKDKNPVENRYWVSVHIFMHVYLPICLIYI